jgi:tetratricopeptide (TPR) repeat protein
LAATRSFDLTPLIDAAKQRFGDEHNTTTDARINLGYALLRSGRFTEAESPLRDVARVREKLTPNTWNLGNARSLLGASLAGQRKFTEAETLLTAGVQGLLDHRRDIPATAVDFFDFAGAAIVSMYKEMGQLDKAALWQGKLEPIQ